MSRLPPINKYPKYLDFKDKASIETDRLHHRAARFEPYCSISDIKTLGYLIKFYSSVYSGHKTRAIKIYRCYLTPESNCLPNWIKEYVDNK